MTREITRMSLASPDTPLYAYLMAHQPPEHPALAGLRETTRTHPRSYMQIAADQGHFMAFLLRLIGASRVLEIGTFTGYSALAMALVLPQDGKVVTCDISPQLVDVGRPFWASAGVADRIEARSGCALETLDALLREGAASSFDAAFVDADKENYGRYYEAALELVRPGGLIIVDNTLKLGQVIDPRNQDEATVVIRELNRRIATDERVDRVMLPIGDGVTLARRRPG